MTYEQFKQTDFYTTTRKYMQETMFKGDLVKIDTVLRDFYFRKEAQGTLNTISQ